MTPETPASQPTPPAPTDTGGAARHIVFLVVFIDLLGFGIVLPLLPRYAEAFASADMPSWTTGVVIGVLYSSFSLMQFFFAPIWGRVSDRVGRRPILLLGLAGSVVFYALFGYASGLTGPDEKSLGLVLLFVSRFGAGIAGATIATAQAVIADTTTPERRSRGMAMIGAAFGIGFTFGPLIAYAAMLWFPESRGGPGYLAAGLSLVALLLGLRLLPETRRPGVGAPHRKFDLSAMYRTLQTPTVGLLVLTFFLATFGFANFEGTLSLMTDKVFNYSDRDNFLVFAFVGFMLMIAQGGFYRPMAKRIDEVTFLRFGIVLMLLGLASLAGVVASAGDSADAAGLKPWFYLSLTLAVFGFAFLTPSVQSLISRRSDPDRQGEVLGVNQGFAALARILGPLMGAVLFFVEGRHMLPFAVGAVILLGLLALVPRIKHA